MATLPNVQTPPELDAPPINEVVCGIVFEELPIDPVLVGAYWANRRDELPERALKLPVGAYQLNMVEAPPLRVWLRSVDAGTLIQIQHDRFYVNWQATGGTYPRFHTIAADLEKELTLFSAFCEEWLSKKPAAQAIELTKVNLLRRGKHWTDVADLARMLPAVEPLIGLTHSEQPTFSVQFSDKRDGAELLSIVVTGLEPGTNEPVIKLENRLMRPVESGEEVLGAFREANKVLDDLFCSYISREEMTKRFGGQP